ncbi:MAG TPA: tryptophan synthase subunit alpha [Chloroflexia bacterium]|nr:tryptophan synthase subunit alpha [Chloroflexia bacterium]
MSRIPGTFRRLNKAGEAALVPYLPAGIPTLDVTRRLLPIIGRQGADLIVIGSASVFTSDAYSPAGHTGAIVADCLSIAAEARRSNEVPLVLLAPHAEIHAHGIARLASECAAAGVDALLVPDLPLAFAGPLAEACRAAAVDLALTVREEGDLERLAELAPVAGGFVLCAAADASTLPSLVEHARVRAELPVVVPSPAGTPDEVAELSRLADGVLLQSALLPVMEGAEEEDLMLDVSEVVRALKEATAKGAPTR